MAEDQNPLHRTACKPLQTPMAPRKTLYIPSLLWKI